MIATICIPYATHHAALLPRAIASVERQTVPTRALVIEDTDKRGPAWGRNRLLEQVETEYVGFCDADDWLEPEFVERCLPTVTKNTYAYTDWFFDDRIQQATDTPWRHEKDWHLVNVLLLTSDARRIGPFDETLAAMEDTDWFLKAALYDICGQRVPAALVHYTAAGMRSAQAVRRGQLDTLKLKLRERYVYKMGCCGQDETVSLLPVGERQEGDVLVMALWHGNHAKHGKATTRKYPRLSWPKTTYIDPRDAARDPASWRIVEAPAIVANGNGHTPPAVSDDKHYEGLEGFAEAVVETGLITPPPSLELMESADAELMNPVVLQKPFTPPLSEALTPDYEKLVKLGRARYA